MYWVLYKAKGVSVDAIAIIAVIGFLIWVLYCLGIIDLMRGEGYWANRRGGGQLRPEIPDEDD